ncbi:MAG TPA: tetratricopeptide repeat protein [Bryobacteraceae bacterium]|jgi:tol-pal system protein YbgF|nr:tetratricopeptide repeat protein [Bryobacteraceae bacterium]
MKFAIVSILAIASVLPVAAQKREIVELQRDVAAMQEQIRTLQRTVDEKLGAMGVQVQQTYDSVNRINTAVAVLESGLRDRVADQLKGVSGPVASLNSKMDSVNGDVQALRTAVEDLNTRVSKLNSQITDLGNSFKMMEVRPAPPGAGPAAGSTTSGPETPPPGLSSSQLYDSALRDLTGGNLDLAMQGFTEYLRYFENTDRAPNALFYIGQIYYNKGAYDDAIKSFDTVLTKYPENPKMADATYMKGMALLKSGRRTEAGKEFLNVIQKYPKSEVAPKARDARRALGLSVPSASATSTSSRRKR